MFDNKAPLRATAVVALLSLLLLVQLVLAGSRHPIPNVRYLDISSCEDRGGTLNYYINDGKREIHCAFGDVRLDPCALYVTQEGSGCR